MSWLREYRSFKGRLNRNEWFKRQFIAGLVGGLALAPLFGIVAIVSPDDMEALLTFATLLSAPVSFVSLSLSVRRLHDIGRSGWWLAPLQTYAIAAPFIFWPNGLSAPWFFFAHVALALGFLVAMLWPSEQAANPFGLPNVGSP